MSMISIVSGEATESDSDNDDTISTAKSEETKAKLLKISGTTQVEIVNGEDSESDTDSASSCSTKKQDVSSEETVISENQIRNMKKNYNSLLHRKLSENNLALYENMNTFFSAVVNEATASLKNTDNQLMKSQLALQSAFSSIRSMRVNAKAIKTTLRNIVIDDNYLHNLVTMKK